MYRVSLTVESWTPFGSCVTAAFTFRLTPHNSTYERKTLLAWPSFSMLDSDYLLEFVSTLFIFSYSNLICQLGSECWLTNEIIYLFVTSKREKITVLLPHLPLIKNLIIKFKKLFKDVVQLEGNQFSKVLHNHFHSKLASLLIVFDIYRADP